MKKPLKPIFGMLTFLFILSACSDKIDDNSTHEKLAQTLFSAIKYNDLELYSKYQESQESIDWKKENWKDYRSDYAERRLKNNTGKEAEYLERIRKEFQEKGMTNWESAKFEMVQFESAENNGYPMARYNKIVFKDGDGGTGEIGITLMHAMDDGWIATIRPEFKGYRRQPSP